METAVNVHMLPAGAPGTVYVLVSTTAEFLPMPILDACRQDTILVSWRLIRSICPLCPSTRPRRVGAPSGRSSANSSAARSGNRTGIH
jgi:hypothetical protein